MLRKDQLSKKHSISSSDDSSVGQVDEFGSLLKYATRDAKRRRKYRHENRSPNLSHSDSEISAELSPDYVLCRELRFDNESDESLENSTLNASGISPIKGMAIIR